MPRKSMEVLTESMLYVLLALRLRPMCGIEIAAAISELSEGRVQLGPATLYTILSKYEQERLIQEIGAEGRKRTYRITQSGLAACRQELARLRRCLADAEKQEGVLSDGEEKEPACLPFSALPDV